MNAKTALMVCVCFFIFYFAGCSSQPPVSVTVSPQFAAVGMGQTTTFSATEVNDTQGVTWTATAGTIDGNGNYTAPTGTQSMTVTVTASSKKDPSKSANATVNVVAPGQVTATANPQVAQYTIAPPSGGKVSVQFGLDTNYGLTTWTQPVPQGGGTTSLFVAGMKGNTLYHIRGVVQFNDGTQYMDNDLPFTTSAYPVANTPVFTVTTTAGMTPQSGVELVDLVNAGGTVEQVLVTDLAGNVLWAYNPTLAAGLVPNPVKLLSNGHFMVNFSNPSPDGTGSLLQEVDLTGAVVWQMTAADLNKALAAATCTGCNITVIGTHHDFLQLTNGHLILIAATTQVISGTTVYGDVIIDLDQNHNPVWLWNEFDHLDTSRHPMGGVGLGTHERGDLLGGRRELDRVDPAPELAREGGLQQWNGHGECAVEIGLPGGFYVGRSNRPDRLVLRAARPLFCYHKYNWAIWIDSV